MMDNPRIPIHRLPGYAVDSEGMVWHKHQRSRSSRTLEGLVHDKPLTPRTLDDVANDLGRRHSIRGATPCTLLHGLWEMRLPDHEGVAPPRNIADWFRDQIAIADSTPWFILENHRCTVAPQTRRFLARHRGTFTHARANLPYVIAGQLLFNALITKDT